MPRYLIFALLGLGLAAAPAAAADLADPPAICFTYMGSPDKLMPAFCVGPDDQNIHSAVRLQPLSQNGFMALENFLLDTADSDKPANSEGVYQVMRREWTAPLYLTRLRSIALFRKIYNQAAAEGREPIPWIEAALQRL